LAAVGQEQTSHIGPPLEAVSGKPDIMSPNTIAQQAIQPGAILNGDTHRGIQ